MFTSPAVDTRQPRKEPRRERWDWAPDRVLTGGGVTGGTGRAGRLQASASLDMTSTLGISGSVWERAPGAGGERGHDVHVRYQAIVAPHQEFLVLKQAEIAPDGLLPKPSVDQIDYSIGR